jgi:hypothetical protein
MIMILNENNKWVLAEPEDQREIAATKEAKEYLSFNIEKYNRILTDFNKIINCNLY